MENNLGPLLVKFPRIPHLIGSNIQQGDDPPQSLSDITDRWVVVSEKMDGANCGISFSTDGRLLLQSRGHYLTGGSRERQFDRLKAWAGAHYSELRSILQDGRFVMYGEWLYARHTVYYDRLPSYFLEFAILDRQTGDFLPSLTRAAMLEGSQIHSVPVIKNGKVDATLLTKFMSRKSFCKTKEWRTSLAEEIAKLGINDPELQDSDMLEGICVSLEDDKRVIGRWKMVRPGFTQALLDEGAHWTARPIVRNRTVESI